MFDTFIRWNLVLRKHNQWTTNNINESNTDFLKKIRIKLKAKIYQQLK